MSLFTLFFLQKFRFSISPKNCSKNFRFFPTRISAHGLAPSSPSAFGPPPLPRRFGPRRSCASSAAVQPDHQQLHNPSDTAAEGLKFDDRRRRGSGQNGAKFWKFRKILQGRKSIARRLWIFGKNFSREPHPLSIRSLEGIKIWNTRGF